MESPVDLCFTEEGCSNSIVLEKQVFRSKVLESHVQLACSLRYCAFPLNGNELCIWDTADDPDHQPLHLIGHHNSITALAFGSKINPLLVCSASRDYVIVWNLDECMKKVLQGLMPQGIVIGTLLGMVLYVRFSPDDQTVAVCAGNKIYMLNAKLWIFSLISGHQYRCVVHVNVKKEREKFYSKMKKFEHLDEIQNTSKVCSPNDFRQEEEEAVETTFPVLRIEHCDVSLNVDVEERGFPSVNNQFLWIGSSTGLFIINMANLELEAVLHYREKEEIYFIIWAFFVYKDYSALTIQVAGSCAFMRKAIAGKWLSSANLSLVPEERNNQTWK
ncbi:hypothetical protein lerEdw1_006191 [Lerista edwardsae]|nr:hypothetical protein lerEdw1_006191 [Lerista edwardsae]